MVFGGILAIRQVCTEVIHLDGICELLLAILNLKDAVLRSSRLDVDLLINTPHWWHTAAASDRGVSLMHRPNHGPYQANKEKRCGE